VQVSLFAFRPGGGRSSVTSSPLIWQALSQPCSLLPESPSSAAVDFGAQISAVRSMKLTPDDVRKVARLARLKLSEEETQRFTEQLGRILEYVHQLDEIETAQVEPMAHAGDLVNVFREDVPVPSLDRQDALANAPKTDGKYFLVPQILEGA